MKTGNTMQRFDIDRWREKLIGQAAVAAIPVMTHPGIEQTGHTVREAVCDAASTTKPFARFARATRRPRPP